jgi:general secretion pathway protein B
MSLILEALRKSEAERRRGEMPDLRAELPPPAAPRSRSLRMLPWLAGSAVVAVAGALLLWRPWSRDAATAIPAAVQSAPIPPVESVRLQPRAAIAQPPPAPRIAEREPPKPQSARPAATTIPDSPPEPASPPASAAEVAPPSVPAADTETAVNAMPADLRKALPPLQLSMHMWDPDPAKRFVILDGERHVEGDSVGPMRIRRIDADGVLFDWQGRAVRLPLR